MDEEIFAADYVIVGAGAVGMAIADTLVAETSARLIIVDRRARPGGHWNDAYPFVRLHGPSATYGVDSLRLGDEHIATSGLNRGLHELASGAEIQAYFSRVMHERLLPSRRVRWLPQHDVGTDGVARPLAGGSRVRLLASRRWIDATRADTQVPATHAPTFAVAAGVCCITPTELVQLHRPSAHHVIIGGGKTAMDTALWLLEHGTPPDSISWIRPRESWLLNRAHVQPSEPFAHRTLAAMTAELEAARDATSLADLFARLEARRLLLRIDPTVQPTMYRCAIVGEAELDRLRQIGKVIRLGHVHAIETDRIVLDQGELATSPQHVHIHCSAVGLPRSGTQPVFQRHRIVAQYVRRCSPSFSAAFIAHLEASLDDDAERNALCEPVPVPEQPLDWLRMHLHSARNQSRWAGRPELQRWLLRSRLEAYSGLFERMSKGNDAAWGALLARWREVRGPGLERLAQLLRSADAVDATQLRSRQRVGAMPTSRLNAREKAASDS